MSRLQYNGVLAHLAADLTAGATTVTFDVPLTHSGGTNVPTLSGGDYFALTLMDENAVPREIVYVTAYAAGATSATVTRGQEGTSGVTHSAGVIVLHAPTVYDYNPLTRSNWNAKGDLWVGTANDAAQILAAAANHRALLTDSDQTPGLKWGSKSPFPLDAIPNTPSAYDDEFEGTSLDPKWTSPLTSNSLNTVTNAFGNSWLTISPNTGVARRAFGIRQASPAGSFTAMAHVVSGNISGSDLRMGAYVGTAGNKGHIVGPFKQDGQVAYIGVSTISNTADWSAFDGTLTGFGTGVSSILLHTWVKLAWDAATSTLTMEWSQDGVKWKPGTSRAGLTQPDQMGLVVYINGAAALSAGEFLGADWFRVTT